MAVAVFQEVEEVSRSEEEKEEERIQDQRRMAIPRLLHSCTPCLVVEQGSGRTFLEKQDNPPGEEVEGHNEEEGSSLAQAVRPHLSHVLERGTAQCVTSEWLQKNPHISIVAQAEGKMQGLSRCTDMSTPPQQCCASMRPL